MASEKSLDEGALRVMADLQRKVASGDITLRQLQELLNKPTVHKWDGDVSKLILPPEKQVQVWEHHIKARGYHTGQQPEMLKKVPEPPTLSEQDIADGYQGVCLFYGWSRNGEELHVADSAEIGWEEITMRFAHHASRCIAFKKDLLTLRAGAKQRPIGWFWRKINLTPRNQKQSLCDVVVGANESMLSFEWFQLIGITHTYFVDYMCAFPKDQFGTRAQRRGNLQRLSRRLSDKTPPEVAEGIQELEKQRPELPTQLLGDLNAARLPSRVDDNDWEKGGFLRFSAHREYGAINVNLSALSGDSPNSPGVYGLLRE